jgi:hypothetical protein
VAGVVALLVLVPLTPTRTANASTTPGPARTTTVVTPSVPTFTSRPEPLAGYEAGDTCSPWDKPGAVKLAGLIRQTYGADQSIGISRPGDCATLPSEHAEGRAVDWMLNASDPADLATATAFLHWLLKPDAAGDQYAMARRLGVMYVIWNRRMWRAYDPSRGWAPYTGSVPHTDHIHLSLSLDGASGRTSYWTDHTLAGPCGAAPAGVGTTDHDAVFVPVTPTRVLNTTNGHGTVAARPCRLAAGSSWAPASMTATVAGVDGVPSTGVEAVALSVMAGPANSPMTVTAGAAGSALPGVRRMSLDWGGRASTMLVLPVSTDGQVTFATSRGATDLQATVLGYYVDPAVLPTTGPVGAHDEFHRVLKQPLLSGVTVGAGATSSIDLTTASVPATASAAVVTVTERATTAGGPVAVYAGGGTPPVQPTLSVGPGERATVTTVVPVSATGTIELANRSAADKVVTIGLVGYYSPATDPGGLLYRWLAPRQVVATGAGVGLASVVAGTQDVDLSGAIGSTVGAVVLQVTATAGGSDTRLSFFNPDNANLQTTDLSVAAGRTVSTTVVVPVSVARHMAIWNLAGKVAMTATVVGTFRTP